MVEILPLLRRLNEHGVRYVIIGGVAANLHGTSRVSLDLDLCAPLDHDNAVRIITALANAHPKWLTRPDLPVIEPDSPFLTHLKNMYLVTDLGRLDVLGELPGVAAFAEVDKKAVERDLGGVSCRVVDIDTLIAAKRFAAREKDRADLRELEILRGGGATEHDR